MSKKPPTSGLSSNWKALQQSLKRKRPTDEESTPPVDSIAFKGLKPTRFSTEKKSMASSISTSGTGNGGKLVLRTTKSQKTAAISATPTSTSTSAEPSPLTSRKATIAWAKEHDLDPSTVSAAYSPSIPLPAPSTLTPANASAKSTDAGRYIAIDCEMVGVGGPFKEQSALARVSLVNYHGHCILDTFVKPKERVTDWRTWVSGVSPKDMANAVTLEEAQTKVHEIINGKILVGHAIQNDLEALFLSHPKRDIRDTARHPAFRVIAKQKNPSLKRLAKAILGVDIQGSAHSSVEDAKVTMMLYRKEKKEFERLAAERWGIIQRGKQKQMPRGGGKKRRKKEAAKAKKGGEGVVNGVAVGASVDGGEEESGDDDESDEEQDFDDWLA
ncbi:hypothetical protein ABW19_dt0207855 [Dactylella cylindrospora]|nr:hypothetical protein ABW19_dt0207855 [Dactylella cylindrospora]